MPPPKSGTSIYSILITKTDSKKRSNSGRTFPARGAPGGPRSQDLLLLVTASCDPLEYVREIGPVSPAKCERTKTPHKATFTRRGRTAGKD